jgi:pyruvate dehydrogenase E2 component (dihydrolipoamide acetyltransferase)
MIATAQGSDGSERSEGRAQSVRLPISRLQRAVIDNLERSDSTVVRATMALTVDASRLFGFREHLAARALAVEQIRPTYSDVLLAILGRTLVRHPRIRTTIDGDEWVEHQQIDISLAVAADDGMLYVPVVRDCDTCTVQELSQQRSELVARARSGRTKSADSRGGCFALTNVGGLLPLEVGTPVINKGQSAILGVGQIADGVLAVDGVPVVRRVLRVFLSIDHRVIDGASASRFLTDVKSGLEDPAEVLRGCS